MLSAKHIIYAVVYRNINIVRSINRELGAPANRFNIMARSAIQGAKVRSDPQQWTLKARLHTWAESVSFDLRLL